MYTTHHSHTIGYIKPATTFGRASGGNRTGTLLRRRRYTYTTDDYHRRHTGTDDWRGNPAPIRTNRGLPGNCLNGYLRRRPIRTILRYRQMGRFQRVAPICASRRYEPLRFGIWFLLRPTKQL